MTWLLALKLLGALAGVIALGMNIRQVLEERAIRRNSRHLWERHDRRRAEAQPHADVERAVAEDPRGSVAEVTRNLNPKTKAALAAWFRSVPREL